MDSRSDDQIQEDWFNREASDIPDDDIDEYDTDNEDEEQEPERESPEIEVVRHEDPAWQLRSTNRQVSPKSRYIAMGIVNQVRKFVGLKPEPTTEIVHPQRAYKPWIHPYARTPTRPSKPHTKTMKGIGNLEEGEPTKKESVGQKSEVRFRGKRRVDRKEATKTRLESVYEADVESEGDKDPTGELGRMKDRSKRVEELLQLQEEGQPEQKGQAKVMEGTYEGT
ncbi:hypothetical protein EJ08DRAFT_698414 [Tothia fuscella]|uniref:Uncharacterized protein n=1 Tax=Tothia fuscella TaxID=1048955 RepID=A0A9P4NPG4_9PEZI|nr:hypothetical protein EJ08DRAFT_698414 [Tothia fuscella]